MQASRFELKYFLTEDLAQQMRPFVQGYIDLDEYSARQPSRSYPTLSLYLDSDNLDTYWWTINGDKNRYKLRLRYYDEKPNSPVYFEIKRRLNNVILKQRAGVRKDAVKILLAGQLPDRDHLLNPDDPKQWFALNHFIELMVRLEAKPKMHIAYLREAYENADNNAVRLTFDRAVESAPNPNGNLIAKSEQAHRVFDPNLVLELKFTERFPNWFCELVQTFHCVQTGAAKFAEGIYTRGESWVTRACPRKPPESLVDEFLSGTSFP